MGWVRANARLTGVVALLALALQFASSFGHFHREWVGQPELAHAAGAGAPHDHDHDHHDHDGPAAPHSCPICIAASFAQSFAAPQPPVLPLPIALAASAPVPEREAPEGDRERGPFQSRAPPLA